MKIRKSYYTTSKIMETYINGRQILYTESFGKRSYDSKEEAAQYILKQFIKDYNLHLSESSKQYIINTLISYGKFNGFIINTIHIPEIGEIE